MFRNLAFETFFLGKKDRIHIINLDQHSSHMEWLMGILCVPMLNQPIY